MILKSLLLTFVVWGTVASLVHAEDELGEPFRSWCELNCSSILKEYDFKLDLNSDLYIECYRLQKQSEQAMMADGRLKFSWVVQFLANSGPCNGTEILPSDMTQTTTDAPTTQPRLINTFPVSTTPISIADTKLFEENEETLPTIDSDEEYSYEDDTVGSTGDVIRKSWKFLWCLLPPLILLLGIILYGAWRLYNMYKYRNYW